MASGPKKAGRVGSKSTFWGVLICVTAEVVTFGCVFGMPNGLFPLLKNIITFGQMNPIFGFLCLAMAVIGGRTLADLMGGGRKMGDASGFTDLEKL